MHEVKSSQVGGRKKYGVFKGSTRVGHWHTGPDSARTQCDRLNKQALTKPRNCICCGAEFQSTGPGHRMCKHCRASTAGIDVDSHPFTVPH
ncbi:MAG: hypothetical protein AAGF71_04160 [Pseudomonadota bacterium]